MLIEQRRQPATIFRIAGNNTGSGQTPIVALADANDAPGITLLEIRKSVVARHAGDPGDQQGKRRLNSICGLTKHGREPAS